MSGILFDQNVPVELLLLTSNRFPNISVLHVASSELKGFSDREIFSWACDNAHCIVTFDSDFADRRAFNITAETGVVLIRISPANATIAFEAISRVLIAFELKQLFGALTVVDKSKIRHRRIAEQ